MMLRLIAQVSQVQCYKPNFNLDDSAFRSLDAAVLVSAEGRDCERDCSRRRSGHTIISSDTRSQQASFANLR
jgi:hypothetical protein